VDGITNEDAQLNGNVFLDQNSIDVLSCIRVYLMNEAIWVGVVESFDASLKLSNVAFWPVRFLILVQRVGVNIESREALCAA
jgi:hypothetical protein